MADTVDISIKIKLIKRLYVTNEILEAGKILYCSDTLEAFFDENTRIRICLGKTSSINTESELEVPSEKDIGSFKIILDTLSLKYANSDFTWIDVKTRDDMVSILGSPDVFEPHNLIKNGKLIAPRTLASCVYDDYGVPIGESLNFLQDYIDKIRFEGIPAEMITSGILDLSRVPKEARLDFRPVQNTEERLALTIDEIQNGDVVQEDSTGRMYFVIDDTKLGTEEAFKEFTVGSIPWASVLNRPISLTLQNGAIGTTLLSTGATVESQKLVMPIVLNVDYVDNGILSIKYGGTGNQTGTAQLIDFIVTDLEELYLAGFRDNGKMAQSGSAKIKAGILTTPGFTANDDSVPSKINNFHTDEIVLDKTNGKKALKAYDDTKNEYYNIITYSNNQGPVFGSSSAKTSIYGSDVVVRGKTSVQLQLGNESGYTAGIKVSESLLETDMPVQVADNIVIRSSSSNNNIANISRQSIKYVSLTATTNADGTSTVSTTEKTAPNCSVIDNYNGKFVFKQEGDTSAKLSMLDDGICINGNLGIANNITIKGNAYIGGTIYGTCSQAKNSDTLDGHHASYFMKSDGSNNTKPPVIIQSSTPTGRTNCIWINSSTGVANYWTGSTWTPISNTWKS